ncbi:MAG: hypothetical protein QM483_10125 [Desulfuromusa sp.]
MSIIPKTEYPPLFQAGLHDIDVDSLEPVFLDPFPDSNHRHELVDGLKKFLQLMQSFAIPLEIWVDGSFSTKKTDPDDVDLFVFGNNADINKMSSDNIDRFQSTFDSHQELKIRYHCDVSFIESILDDVRAECRGLFGFSRNEQPKGIPRIWINHE